MTKERRAFTPKERLSIVQDSQSEGRSQTLRKYNLLPSLYNKCRTKYLKDGIEGLKRKYQWVEPVVNELQVEMTGQNGLLPYQRWKSRSNRSCKKKNFYRELDKIMVINQ